MKYLDDDNINDKCFGYWPSFLRLSWCYDDDNNNNDDDDDDDDVI